jgi:hypothetical protein
MVNEHKMNRDNIRNCEQGQSLTELALTMTFLLILLAGIVDFGRAFFTYIALRDAAQEGALYASYEPTDCAGILQRIQDTSNRPFDISGSTLNVVVSSYNCASPPADPTPCAGDDVQVSVTYEDFPVTMPFLGALIGRQSFDISASIKDTVLTPVCP